VISRHGSDESRTVVMGGPPPRGHIQRVRHHPDDPWFASVCLVLGLRRRSRSPRCNSSCRLQGEASPALPVATVYNRRSGDAYGGGSAGRHPARMRTTCTDRCDSERKPDQSGQHLPSGPGASRRPYNALSMAICSSATTAIFSESPDVSVGCVTGREGVGRGRPGRAWRGRSARWVSGTRRRVG
jgi:hypothetical protein